jgi:hypothetical protein
MRVGIRESGKTSLLTRLFWRSRLDEKSGHCIPIYAAEDVDETVVPSTVAAAPMRSRGKNSHTRINA